MNTPSRPVSSDPPLAQPSSVDTHIDADRAVPSPAGDAPSIRRRALANVGSVWWRSVRHMDRARIEALLMQGVDPCRSNKDGHTALGWLAQGLVPLPRLNDAAAITAMLVNAGADPLQEEPSGGAAPLVQALRTAQQVWPTADPCIAHAMVRAMVWSSDPQDLRAGRALQAAIQAPQAHGTVALLLDHGVSPNTFWRGRPVQPAARAVSALGLTLRNGRTEDLIVLLKAGATLCDAERAHEQDPYLLAATTQALAGEKKVDQDMRRRTHLIALLDHQVPMGEAGRGRIMPLMVQHACIDPDLLDRLHAQGASWNGTLRDGQTPLHMVMENPAPEALLDHVLHQGLDPMAVTTRGATPIERLRKQVARRPALAPLLTRLEAQVLIATLHEQDVGQTPEEPTFRRSRL